MEWPNERLRMGQTAILHNATGPDTLCQVCSALDDDVACMRLFYCASNVVWHSHDDGDEHELFHMFHLKLLMPHACGTVQPNATGLYVTAHTVMSKSMQHVDSSCCHCLRELDTVLHAACYQQ